VYVFASGNGATADFTIEGGTISGNTGLGGGGVAVCGSAGGTSTFTMNGGTISNNETSGRGGGVDVWASLGFVYFTMCGGTISGNTASGSGGGVSVYTDPGTATFKKADADDGDSGVIYGSNADAVLKNTAGGNGDAVYVESGPKKRNSTAGPDVTLDSDISGAGGGWDP
jgi:hypothetical protein